MSRNSIILAVLGGAAVAALLTNYLQTEKGRELLETASSTLKDLTMKATEYAKNNMPGVAKTVTDGVQAS